MRTSDEIDAYPEIRLILARLSDRQSQTILASPLARVLTPLIKRSQMAKADEDFRKLRRAPGDTAPMPVRNIDLGNLEAWSPRRAGAQVVMHDVKIKERKRKESPAHRLIKIQKGNFRPLYISILRNSPPCQLNRADAVIIAVGRAAKPAAMSFRIPVGKYTMSSLASERFLLESAWRHVKQGGLAAGVDGISHRSVRDPAQFITIARGRMLQDRIEPLPSKQVYIPKADNIRWRTLAVPSLRDRLIQTAINDVIAPLYEERFLDVSYGFRPQRSTMDAIRQIRLFLDEGYRWGVCIDMKDYFETVNWTILEQFLTDDLIDHRMVRWIMTQVKSKIRPAAFPTTGDTSNLTPPPADGSDIERTRGVPQGAPLSPLLSNLFLHRFDEWAVHNRFRMVRFADDITLFAKTKRAANRIMENASYYLESRLDVTVNRKKSVIVDSGGGEPLPALGFEIINGRIAASQRNIDNCKEVLTGILELPEDTFTRREIFTNCARGWRAYFATFRDKNQLIEMEQWADGMLRKFEAGK